MRSRSALPLVRLTTGQRSAMRCKAGRLSGKKIDAVARREIDLPQRFQRRLVDAARGKRALHGDMALRSEVMGEVGALGGDLGTQRAHGRDGPCARDVGIVLAQVRVHLAVRTLQGRQYRPQRVVQVEREGAYAHVGQQDQLPVTCRT